jgi:hypothetical protein
VAAVALFVSMCSPLNPFSSSVPGIDSSVFLTIAQGILHGKLPYVDFFDHKGPLVYFIDTLGLFIGGFTGVWLLELLFMVVSIFFAYKTARFFGNKPEALMGVAYSFLLIAWFYRAGNLSLRYSPAGEWGVSEEYILPFIFASLYIFTKHYFTKIELSKIQITVLGFCFAFSLLLKSNMFAVWAAFCAVIFFRKLSQKDYNIILRYMVFFLTGVVILFTPVILYLKYTGSYDDFIQQYWSFNVTYTSTSIFQHTIYFLLTINRSLLPVIITLIWLLKKPYKTQYDFYIAYALSLFFSFCLIAMGKYDAVHHHIVVIPLFVPAITFCFDQLFKLFSSARYSCVKYGTPILIACIFSGQIIFTALLSMNENIGHESRNALMQMGQFVDNNTNKGDSITVLGSNCAVYLFTDRPSFSKYIYQTPIMYVDPKIANDYIFDVTHRKPAMIIIPSYNDDQFSFAKDVFSPILEMIDEEYYECFKSERYVIFKRSEQKPCGISSGSRIESNV